MVKNIADIKGTTERLVTCIGAFTIVNQADLVAIMPGKDVGNNIRQLKHNGIVETKNIDGMKLIYLTEKGQKKLEKYGNYFQEEFELDFFLEPRDYSRKSYQRHSRGKIAFMVGGVNVSNIADMNMGDNTPVYIDGYKIKKAMGYGDEIRSSRVTGICLTPEESFVVYCCEGGFTKVERTEQAYKNKLIRTLPQSRNRSELKEIVVGTDIKSLKGLLYGRRQVNRDTTNYIADSTDRNKYFVPVDCSRLQIRLLINAEFRDEIINRRLEESLSDVLPGLKRISNREITDYDNGKVVNLLDLNMGLIKQVRYYADDGKNVTAIILSEYEEFFNELYNHTVNLITINELKDTMKQAGIER